MWTNDDDDNGSKHERKRRMAVNLFSLGKECCKYEGSERGSEEGGGGGRKGEGAGRGRLVYCTAYFHSACLQTLKSSFFMSYPYFAQRKTILLTQFMFNRIKIKRKKNPKNSC